MSSISTIESIVEVYAPDFPSSHDTAIPLQRVRRRHFANVEYDLMRVKPTFATIASWQTERVERVNRAVDVIGLALRLFGAVEFACAWLASPNVDLRRRRPCDLIFTARGASLVSALLRRQLTANREVLALADTILGVGGDADAWIKSPNPHLGGFAPIDVLRGPAGAEVVEGLLSDIRVAKCGPSP
jgi:uncharacterized protein (DUF2384 family)